MTVKIGTLSWGRVGGWIVRLILVLFIALEVHSWLDILVFKPEEYDRLIGSETACGMFKSYCSWPAFLLDQSPFTAMAILSTIALLWRGLPRRELILGALVVANCGYFAWRAYGIQLDVAMN
jgi:hypothetical protein